MRVALSTIVCNLNLIELDYTIIIRKSKKSILKEILPQIVLDFTETV